MPSEPRSVTRCRCGHESGDHAPSLRWRPGWLRGLCAGPCAYCSCRAFHLPPAAPPAPELGPDVDGFGGIRTKDPA